MIFLSEGTFRAFSLMVKVSEPGEVYFIFWLSFAQNEVTKFPTYFQGPYYIELLIPENMVMTTFKLE